jgi:4-diphosphocytidyl-2-C-methyl-D-erythritol kinase
MLAFPNCKINLGLNIIRKRADGFHDIETVFYPVYKLHDALEILPSTAPISPVDFNMTGLSVDGDSANNLCVKAYQLLQHHYPELPAIRMHLHKTIPMGAGLGGGSADGAFALKLLNDVFHLKLSKEQLINYALQLGSDCPFFIINKPCFASGRGEIMTELPLNLSGYSMVLINPGIHINTGWAFGQITPQQPPMDLQNLIQQPIETWKGVVKNDFEPAVIISHPIIGNIKETLYQNGAVYASMSGSGSTVYGIFSAGKMPFTKLFPQFLELHLAL